MSEFEKSQDEGLTRRDFLCAGAATLAAMSVVRPGFANPQGQTPVAPVVKALDDPNITHGEISFASGATMIDGYLSHPKRAGKFPIVIVVAGNIISEEYIRNTTAILAQGGFVGLAPDIFALQTESMTPAEKREVFVNKITDEHVFADIEAGIRYLRQQPFVKRGRIGITGFCFGGRVSLLFAARNKEVGAAVPFYGNLRLPPELNRPVGPFEVISKIKAPVQGHYALQDDTITQPDIQSFFETLRHQGTTAELFEYEAAHGFFAYTRKSYNAEAATLGRERMLAFFKMHLR